jgi:hypothetical protein
VQRVNRGIGDGETSDLPWASIFDSTANVRALSAVQAEGFRAASELVDRFIRIASNGLGGGLGGATNGHRNGHERPLTSASFLTDDQRADLFGAIDFEPLIRSWWSTIGQFMLGPTSRPTDPDAASPATLDFATPESQGRLDLGVEVGGAATAEVWLHNTGGTDLGQIHLRCSDLLADDGSLLGSAAVTFEPAVVPMPRRSSRGIDVRLEVPHDVQPGVYRGTVLTQGHPDHWLPIVATISTPAS